MANNKKFIVKNGLLTQDSVVIGSSSFNQTDILQVTGDSAFSGEVKVSQSDLTAPSLDITNSGGAGSSIAVFKGTTGQVGIINVDTGDYAFYNSANTGIQFNSDAEGLKFLFENAVKLQITDTAVDFKIDPTVNGSTIWYADNDGSGSGLDADLLDGIDSAQFLRSDEDDTMDGNLTITGNLTVNGTTTYVNTEEILLSDSVITLNANYTGSTPTENAGIEVERGTLDNPKLVWNETSDYWQLEAGGLVIGRIITTADEAKNGGTFDADTVDGLQAAQFLRSDVDDTAAGNIRIEQALTVGNNTAGAYIYMDGTGNNRTIYSDAGEIGFLNAGFNYAARSDANDNWIVGNDVKAKRFLDTDNENWLLDPSGTSVLNGIFLGGRLTHLDDVDTYINFPAEDSFEVRTGGVQRLLVNNSGVSVANSVSAPIYYDADDVSFYGDFAGASRVNDVNLVGQIIHDGDADTYLDFNAADSFQVVTGGTARLTVSNTAVTSSVDLIAPRLVDSANSNYYVDPASLSVLNSLNVYSGNTDTETNLGLNANEKFSIRTTQGQGYITYYQDDADTTNHSVNFEINSPGSGTQRFYFNKDIYLNSNNLVSSGAVIGGVMYASTYYDSDNESYYGNFASTGTSINIAGAIHAGNGTTLAPSYTFGSDNNTGMYRAGADTIGFSAGGNQEFLVYNSYTLSPGSSRAPIFYDSDNTSYYANPASKSILNGIGIDQRIEHNGDTDTYIQFGGNGVFQVYADGTYVSRFQAADITSYVDVYAPAFYTGDYVYHTGDVNTYIGFNAADTFGVWTGGTNKLSIDTDSADFSVNVYAPVYYDSSNANYYGDFAATSVMNTIGIDADLYHNGDADTKLSFGTDSVSLQTGGSARLTVNNTSVTAAVNTYAPAFYTNDYLVHNGDTDTYVGFDAVDNFGVWVGGTQMVDVSTTNVGFGTTTPDAFFSINKPTAVGTNPTAVGNILFSLGDAGVTDYSIRTDSFGNIYHINDNGGNEVWYDSGFSARFAVLNDNSVVVGNDSYTYATPDVTTNFITTPSANKFHVSGGIQLESSADVISIGAATSNTAINEATFLTTNELGFGAGGGFYMNETTTVRVRGNKNLETTGSITGGDVYGARFIDTDNNNYYADPSATSVLNAVGIDSELFHNGDTDTKLSFGTDTITLYTAGLDVLVANNSVIDSSVDIIAPRIVDRNNSNYFLDANATSQLFRVDIDDYIRHNGDTDTYVGFPSADNFRIVTGNSQRVNISTVADIDVQIQAIHGSLTAPSYSFDLDSNTGMYRYAADTLGFSAGGNDEFRVYTDHTLSVGSSRAPIFYDSQNTAFFADPGSTSLFNVMRANQYQLDGSSILIDSPNGDYGSIKVEGDKGGWAGYAIRDDYVFMSNGSSNFGIYNDTDNEWMIYGTRNAGLDLYFNGSKQAETENGYFLATNQMRAPIYYDSNNTSYFLNPAAGNTNQALKINGRIYRDGFANDNGATNMFLQAQDLNQFIWNTAANWGVFWSTNSSSAYRYAPFGDNMISFVGAGNVRAAIDLDDGNGYFQGELIAANYRLNGGNEDLGLLKTYGSGLADAKLFDATEYWDKRVVKPMQGAENAVTTSTSEWVKATDGPFAGGYVLQTSGYRTFDSDYIPVEPGEEIYAEISAKLVSGSGGLLYLGVRRYDKDKRPIAGNDGIDYFAAAAADVTSTGWTTYSGHHTLPTSHTPYNGSDGGGVKYVRLILLINYSAGGAIRQFGPPILKRSSLHSNVSVRNIKAAGSIDATGNLDVDGYGDFGGNVVAGGTVTGTSFIDANNTSYYVNPNAGANVSGTWNFNNGALENLNSLTFNDPGVNEGIHWKGGNNWRIFESPNNLTNAAGNLQIMYNNNQLALRLETDGDAVIGRYAYAQRFYDSNDGNYYLDPNGTSVLNQALFRSSTPLRFSTTSTALFDHEGNATPVAFRMNKGGTSLSDGTDFGVLQLSRTNHNNSSASAGAGLYFNLKDSAGSLREYAGILGRKTVSGTGGGELRFMTYGRAVQAYLNSDYFYHVSDIRSPIFYDSNNTGYYADMAGTSIFNYHRANRFEFASSTYYGRQAYGSYGTMSVIGNRNGWAGYAINDDWVFMANGANNSGIYNDTDNEWAIQFTRNADTQIYYNGTWEERSRSGYMEARGSYRAPIFYDSNDTTYRIDGNNTSVLLNLNINGTLQVNGYNQNNPVSGQWYQQSTYAYDSTNGMRHYWILVGRTNNGGSKGILEYYAKDDVNYSGNAIGRVVISSWNNSSISVDHHLTGPANGVTPEVRIDNSNNLWLRMVGNEWDSWLRWRWIRADGMTLFDGSTKVDSLGGNVPNASSNTILAGQQVRATLGNVTGAVPTNTQNIVGGLYSRGNVYGSIFYDTDNTGYYVNPNGFSRINEVSADRINVVNGGPQYFYTSSGNIRGYIRATESNDSHFEFATSGGEDIIFRDGGFGGSWNLIVRGDGNVLTSGAHYAGIFYDRNNTNYYGDFASTSRMNVVRANDYYADNWFRNYNSGEGLYNEATGMHWYSDGATSFRIRSNQTTTNIRFATSGNSTRGYVYADNSNNIGFLNSSGGWSFRTNGGTLEAYGSLYANIMYDRNNTGYYCDPSSTSVLNEVRAQRFVHVDDVSQNDQFGLYFAAGKSTAYAIYNEAGGWSFPYPDLRIAFHTGIKFGANASYNGMRFYNDYNMATQVMSVNNGSDGLGANNVYINQGLQIGGQLRAPIMYDTNNTGYYVDPNSTSRMATINANRFNLASSSYWITFYGNNSDYHAIGSRSNTGGASDDIRINSYGSVYINLDSNVNNSSGADFRIGRHGAATGSIQNLGLFDVYGDALYVYSGYSFRSPIFYDSNNTGYYGNFASTSRYNTVHSNEDYVYGWQRNFNAGTGIYNQATGVHAYSSSAQYYNITGNNNGAAINLRLMGGYNGTVRMWLHGDSGISQGFLNAAGAWKMRSVVADGYSPTWWFHESGDESWTGNPGNDEGKVEYHANRFYIAAGTNSNRIVQFRQGGSDRSYIANDGVFVGTATSARWADLAERYEADDIYEPGTILGVNLDGDSEVTLYQPGMPVAGAISTNPGYRMNEHIDYLDDDSIQSKMNPFIALKGRIPVKVNGEVRKGQWVVADRDGKGRGVDYGTDGINSHDIIGIALSNSENGEVEVKV